MTGPSLRRIAWHEAGHAVVALDQGFTVVLLSVRPKDDGSLGRSKHISTGDCAVRSERDRENIVAMAGWAAEIASDEASDGMTYDSGDMTAVLSRIDQHSPSTVDVELGWAECEAHRIVSANKDRVERLAHELLKQGELSDRDEILVVINGRD